jgi:hypothetical protein
MCPVGCQGGPDSIAIHYKKHPVVGYYHGSPTLVKLLTEQSTSRWPFDSMEASKIDEVAEKSPQQQLKVT